MKKAIIALLVITSPVISIGLLVGLGPKRAMELFNEMYDKIASKFRRK